MSFAVAPQENQQIPRHPNSLAIYLNIYYFALGCSKYCSTFLSLAQIILFSLLSIFSKNKQY
jgi:hypothetical protein